MHSLYTRVRRRLTAALVLVASSGLLVSCLASTTLDLSKATIVVRSGTLPAGERIAARVLVEEVEKRTGLYWPITTNWPPRGVVIAISSGSGGAGWKKPMPRRKGTDLPENRAEGFRLVVCRTICQVFAWA